MKLSFGRYDPHLDKDNLMTEDNDDTFELPEDYTPRKPDRPGKVDPKALTVAMMSSEADVDLPGTRQAGSVVSNLISLSVGECFTKSLLVDNTVTMKVLQQQLNAWKHKLRQSVNQAVRRARDYDERTLSMETTQTITPSGRVYVQIIVTRTE